ncbi:FAD/NAD(P)-binding domain-containing protein [Hyaloscypha variabilis F]|uniref:FAD/NAD(P)-binding domain-containing protein n=1 Tax=Hyaloscypha variabilis (strain UAMH 11265 / GT02V1 / F) TaxID=1149755 RepID=A0A2J6RUG6_HYAVF|nr:FAD/NAD(P)-binding domain-containing protein [Hyaloscypha variabilis F]
MPQTTSLNSKLRVAIIGAGPAGLGAAIEFGKLPFVDWTIYEQATAIREIGAGISIQPTTWRLVEVMGAAKNLVPEDYYQPADHHAVQHRNGRTGELLASHGQGSEKPGSPKTLCLRTSRLITIEEQPSGKLLLKFEDGFTDLVDLLVGADGVRSVVRSFAFPDHKIGYIGRTAYRTIVTPADIATVPGVPDAVIFWHDPHSWLYTCALGANRYEITTMTRDMAKQSEKEKVSWEQNATTEQMADNFKDFSPLVKDILALAKDVKQYALFAGPRLESIVAHGSVALVGDASHPLSGAFGSGAGFALEDVYALTQGVAWAHEQGHSLREALELLDKVRGPHYKRLYDILDQFGETAAYLNIREFTFDEAVEILVEKNWGERHTWMYEYDIQKAFRDTGEREGADHLPPESSDFQGGLSRL